MIKNSYMAMLMLNENEEDIRSLTKNRPLASIPIYGRYRIVDFILSNIVNCGIRNVGIFSPNNSRSFIDHLGTGRSWDLSRNVDGLFLFSSYSKYRYQQSEGLLKNFIEYLIYMDDQLEDLKAGTSFKKFWNWKKMNLFSNGFEMISALKF